MTTPTPTTDQQYTNFLASLTIDQKVGIEEDGQVIRGEVVSMGLVFFIVMMPCNGRKRSVLRHFFRAEFGDAAGTERRNPDTKRIRYEQRSFMPYDGIDRRPVPLPVSNDHRTKGDAD